MEYTQTQCALSGQSMTYELSPHHFQIRQEAESGSRICYMAVTLTGQGESQARMRRDGNDVLVYSQDAPCQVAVEVRWQPGAPESNDGWESHRLDLGQCPAGQWGRITYNGVDTVLTVEPNPPSDGPSPWLWAGIPAALALTAALVLLLRRRKRRAQTEAA